MMSVADARRQPCPTCGVEPGEACLDVRGIPTTGVRRAIKGVHAKRRERRLGAYERVGWDRLSPWLRSEVDRVAREAGVTLHHATDEETLRRFIRIARIANL